MTPRIRPLFVSAYAASLVPMLIFNSSVNTPISSRNPSARGESVELVDEVLSSDTARREALKAFEEARAQQKEIGKKVAFRPGGREGQAHRRNQGTVPEGLEYKSKADSAAEEYTTAMWKLSNIVEKPEAPRRRRG